MSRTFTSSITSSVPILLIDYVASRFTYCNRAQWLVFAGEGRLSVNGVVVPGDVMVSPGDTLRFEPPAMEEPDVDTGYSLAYETPDFIVIDKPAQLPVHPSGRFQHNTLWNLLSPVYPGIHFFSRLDRETSGLMVASISRAGSKMLSKLAGEKGLVKEYRVLVHGVFPEILTADGWLFPCPDAAVRKKRCFSYTQPESASEFASTRFERISTDGRYSLLKAHLGTGRTHQIRATLCSLGFPVVGDKLYGLDEHFFIRFSRSELNDSDKSRLVLSRQALHSAKLVLGFPSPIEVVSPLPPEISVLIDSN